MPAAPLGTAAYRQFLDLGGRILLAALLPIVIATEVPGSLAIIAGWHTRIAAFLLAGFSLLAAGFFHHDFADQTQLILFLSDVAVAGGLLTLAANGAGPLSLDHRRGR